MPKPSDYHPRPDDLHFVGPWPRAGSRPRRDQDSPLDGLAKNTGTNRWPKHPDSIIPVLFESGADTNCGDRRSPSAAGLNDPPGGTDISCLVHPYWHVKRP